jgi:hypothetical protein
MSVIGGPFEVSMPWPELDAGGFLAAGERASLPEAAGCREKYDGEVAEEVEMCVVGVVKVGVVGLLERLLCDGEGRAPCELVEDGRRSRAGSLGAVRVGVWGV